MGIESDQCDEIIQENGIKYEINDYGDTVLIVGKIDNCVMIVLNLEEKENNEIYIPDWRVNVENKGYGTKALAFLNKYCIKNGYTVITGDLSPVDDMRRLAHFYNRNGYEIFERVNPGNKFRFYIRKNIT
jgi:GNAT superfamily N-acetyltransferase